MNKGMQFLFKSLGIEITPETMAMLAALLPQLPAKINEVVQAVNAALTNFDMRLRAIEACLDAIGHEQARINAELQEVAQNGRREPAAILGPGAGNAIDTGRRGGRRANSGASDTGTGTGNGGGFNNAGG
jgi:hypothetical protein